ncbi:sensor histidine kinase [Reticulibacter mediterranei]|uniref:sensor histidine kinase n=1 Tax=Reticulibacter mediterranei TaxID=2778369 RepID=UPI001C694145|nr:HAMP domain-containing sensor histidine kinase [Reticulibacter mediterranei]
MDSFPDFQKDVTSREQIVELQEEARRAREELRVLTKVSNVLLSPEALRDLQTVYRTIYQQLKSLLPIDFFAIDRYDQRQEKIIQEFKVEDGEILSFPANKALPPLFLEFLGQEEQALIFYSTQEEWMRIKAAMPRLADTLENDLSLPSGRKPRSGISLVIRHEKEPLGILTALSFKEHSFERQHLDMLIAISMQIAIAIKNASMYSELRQALKIAQESERLQNHFLMTASHELRTPLTAVQGYLELLDTFSGTLSEDTKKQFLSNAHRASEELGLLLGNIMDASRIDQDKVEMHLRSIRLLDPICTIVEIMEPLLIRESRPVEIHIPDTLYVIADELRFRQVMLNLIGNALKYSPAPQGIAIRAESLTYDQLTDRIPLTKQIAPLSVQQRYAVVALRDWGPGIAPEDQQRLFTKFMRLNRAINSTQRGAGLGLYLCRQLTEAMNGYIWMESEGIPGEGSTFYVALPQSE